MSLSISAVAALLVLANANPFTPHLNEQRRVAAAYEPAPLQAPVRATPGEIVPVRLRFYADDEYRAGQVRWQERIRTQLGQLNQFVAGLGVRFEAVEFKRWTRKQGSGDVEKVLKELEALDKGGDVDWVVGLVTPLAEVSTSMHALGFARPLGRHFVLRGMADVAEAKAIESFHLMDPQEREGLYARRKWHKETALFLHEWFHTLGLPHASEPHRIMHPAYSHQMTGISAADAEVVLAALNARLKARGVGEPDWLALADTLEKRQDSGWYTREREELIRFARGGAPPSAGDAAPNASTLSSIPEDVGHYNQALEYAQAGKTAEALAEARPLAERHPKDASVARLLCRLGSGGKKGSDEALVDCERARALNPEDPVVSLDAAQVLLFRKDRAGALAATDEARSRAAARTKGDKAVWLWIAQIYGELGALSRADEAVSQADAADKKVAEVKAELGRRRVWFGLTPGSSYKLKPEVEPQYAARVREAQDLLAAGKRKEARAAVLAGLKAFPEAPGLETVACELAMRDGKAREAEQRCGRAIKKGDVARAHFLMGYLRFQTGRVPAAVTSLKRAIELDPEDVGPWQTLAETYRMTGKRKELDALRTDYQGRFGKKLP